MNLDDPGSYEATRQRHQADARAQLPEHFERLAWPRERLRLERQARLRRLLTLARERSPWHRQRLAHVDIERVDEAQLGSIPPMTKDDLMQHFDRVLTEPRLTLSRVEDHLATLRSDAYLLGSYHAVASGGSSGRRGVYVYDWNGWIGWYLTVIRQALRLQASAPQPSAGGEPGAVVVGERASHVSRAAAQTFRDSGAVVWTRFPVTTPWAEQLSNLETLRPRVLVSYPSFLHQLTHAQEAGKLSLAPRVVVSSGEPLLPEIRAGIERVWGCAIINSWASSEAGGMGVGCGRGPGVHLCDDLLIIEPVDREGKAVQPGARSAKLYVTNLFNDVLPLIRFEITDEVSITDVPCPCGSAHRIAADIEGRLDDSFEYPGVTPIHPHLFRSRLGRERNIVEYQVRQRERGADVAVHMQGPVDLEPIRADLVAALGRAGLEGAEVSLRSEPGFDRTATGKLKRFIPLGSPG